MFGRSTKNQPASATARKTSSSPSVIAADMYVLGNIVSEGALDIDGKIEGNVRCHKAIIRPNGKVRGDVTAEAVDVHGTVEGLIKAQLVTLYASAKVTGTIMHESLSIEDGAFVDGKFKRTDKIFIEDTDMVSMRRLQAPVIDSTLDDTDGAEHEPSEAEIKVLHNLRLIS